MKKNLAIVFVLSLCIFLASCSANGIPEKILDNTGLVINTTRAADPEGLEGLEYLLAHSTNFLRAKLIGIEQFDDFAYELHYEVVENYAGYAPGEITVYEMYVEGRHIIGGEAHLMLYGGNSAYYPHTIYTSIDKDFFVQEGTPAEIGGREYSLEQLINEAQKSEASGELGKRSREYSEAPSGSMGLQSFSESMGLEGAYSEADVVLEVLLGPEQQLNKYVSDYTIVEASIVKSGQADGQIYAEGDLIMLPPGLGQNVPYCILLKENARGGLGPFSTDFIAVPAESFYSIIQIEDPIVQTDDSMDQMDDGPIVK
ncbi:MAG: hypothetical protein FWG10_04175 [Eubacteriaceae bacterium]|nr:hypothetical protein [Eubacteriaceae bacterium]